MKDFKYVFFLCVCVRGRGGGGGREREREIVENKLESKQRFRDFL